MSARNRNFGTAMRERERRIAGLLDDPYDTTAGTAISDTAGNAFWGSLRELKDRAAKAGMGFRADLSGLGRDDMGDPSRAGLYGGLNPIERESAKNRAIMREGDADVAAAKAERFAQDAMVDARRDQLVGDVKSAELERGVNEAFADPRASRQQVLERLPPALRPQFQAQWAKQDAERLTAEAAATKARRDDSPLVAVMGRDGRSILVPRQMAVGQQPASSREQGRAVSSKDAGDIADINTSLAELGRVRGAVKDPGTLTKIQSWMPTFVSEMTGGWTDDANEQNAVISRVRQVIGKAMEGGVLRKEDEIKYRSILPVLGDSKAVLESKIDGVRSMLLGKMNDQLNALQDAGYEVGNFRARGPNNQTGAEPPADPRFSTIREGAKKSIPGIEGGLAEYRNGRWVRVQ